MGFEIPKRQLKSIQTQKRNVPIDQIIAVQGQNPLAHGIDTAGNVLGQAMSQRLEMQRQGQQLAALEKISGQQPGAYADLDPATAATFAQATMKQNSEGKKKLIQGTYTDPVTKKIYQPFYDEKTDKIDYQELKGPQVIPPKGGDGTLVQSGLFDENGQPIMINNKSGQSQTISLPKGTLGKTQTRTQLAPTAQTRASGEFAATVIPHIQDFKGQITLADQAGYLGPLRGRYQEFMTGKVGTTGNTADDYMLGKLKSTRDFLGSGTMKAHVGSRGGGEMLEHFLSDMDTGKQSAAVLQGELDGLLPFMQGYVDAGKGNVFKTPALTGKKKSLADKLGL